MKMFGSSNSDKIKFLEDERGKIWTRLVQLEEVVEKKTPEHEKEARQASKKASEFRNRSKETKEQIDILHKDLSLINDKSKELEVSIEQVLVTVNQKLSDIELVEHAILETDNEVKKSSESLQARIEKMDSIYDDHPDLEGEVDNLDSTLEKVEDNSIKISTLLKSVTSRKNDIDELYYAIIGYDDEDEETGEITHVEGLKDKLEIQYQSLQSKFKELEVKIENIEEESDSNYSAFAEEKNIKTQGVIDGWITKYEELQNKIQALLPNALTAGLSSAFSMKKDDEVNLFGQLKLQFNIGIIGLIVVSIIPFILSVVFLINGDDLEMVINRIPRIVLAILPLYFPVLWLAYSANKKMNLSKRLIEEYAHKEVLSKTFEGLSTQIKNIDDEDISNDLKVKLLYNFLEVYSENPGKLISNYESSDHPVMDVLEQSYKLESVIDKIQNIPGMEHFVKILDRKSNRILKKKSEMISAGLDNISNEDEIGQT